MQNDHFGFSYSWADLAPIRGLVALVVAAQFVGFVAGALVRPFPSLFESAWCGGAIATFPAFIVGLLLQLKLNRPSISENKRMVWHLGLVAAALSVGAVVMPLLGFGE
jgi:hypothetical protein